MESVCEAQHSLQSCQLVSATHPNVASTIEEVLALQRKLLIKYNHSSLLHNIDSPDASDSQLAEARSLLAQGFLVTEMSVTDLVAFLEQGGIIIRNSHPVDPSRLSGYALLTSAQSFRKLCGPAGVRFKLKEGLDAEVWNEFISDRAVRYIEQIAVERSLVRTGIGTKIIAEILKQNPSGVVADILQGPQPFVNGASFAFFSHSGFTEVGTLFQESCPGFRDCVTAVVAWSERSCREQ